MRRRTPLVVLVSLAAGLLFAAAPARAAKVKEQEPGPKAAGTLCAWTSKDGLVDWHRVPKAYDPAKGAFDGEPWIGHLPMFLRGFDGVPECETLRAAVLGLLERQEKDGGKHLRKFWPALQKGDAGDAFKAGAAALERGFPWFPTGDARFRENLAAWRKDAKALGLRRGDTKACDATSEDFEKALVAGAKAFDKVNLGADAW